MYFSLTTQDGKQGLCVRLCEADDSAPGEAVGGGGQGGAAQRRGGLAARHGDRHPPGPALLGQARRVQHGERMYIAVYCCLLCILLQRFDVRDFCSVNLIPVCVAFLANARFACTAWRSCCGPETDSFDAPASLRCLRCAPSATPPRALASLWSPVLRNRHTPGQFLRDLYLPRRWRR